MKGADQVAQTPVPEHFITAYEAAERMGYHPDWMKVRIRNGEVPSAIKGQHNAWWVDPADISMLESGKGMTFWEKVVKSQGCWQWTGYAVDGYGQHAGTQAHRYAYTELVGPIPEGLTIDHLCRNRSCVNPDHMEPVTRAENTRRAFALKTHCKRGHEFDAANTYRTKGGHRSCRKCTSLSQQRYQQRKAASSQ